MNNLLDVDMTLILTWVWLDFELMLTWLWLHLTLHLINCPTFSTYINVWLEFHLKKTSNNISGIICFFGRILPPSFVMLFKQVMLLCKQVMLFKSVMLFKQVMLCKQVMFFISYTSSIYLYSIIGEKMKHQNYVN